MRKLANRNSGQIYKACKWGMIQGAKSVLEKFRLCKEVGFDGMELISPLDAEISEVLAASRETQMPVHGLVNIQGNRKFRLSSPDAATREKGRELLEQSIRNCRAYGGSSVLLVPGRVRPDEATHDDVWHRSIPLIRSVLPVASRLGVRILVETVWNGFCEKPEQMRDYIDEIDSPWVGVYFDIGNMEKFAPSENWIRALGPRIVKVDIKDWSKATGFCKIGEGAVNWPAVCDALAEINFSGWATAEVKGGGRDWLADVADRMDQVLEIRDSN